MSAEDIIAKVKSQPELWQTKHPLHRKRFITRRIWRQISKELGVNELLLRKKWKHIKDRFMKEQKKILSKTMETCYWQHYDRLYFLSKDYQDQLAQPIVDTSKLADGTTETSGDERKSNSDSDERPLKAKRPKKSSVKKLKPALLGSKLPLQKTQEVTDTNSLVTKSPDSGKLNFILNRLSAMETAIENRKLPAEDKTRNDSDYTYILSLLPIMKKLSEIQKLQFRGKLNDWLLEIVTQNEYSSSDYKAFLQNEIVDKIVPND